MRHSQEMINPSDSSPQSRPAKVVFTSPVLFHVMKKSLMEIEVEPCFVENVANGLAENIKAISQQMVKDGLADRDASTADQPSLSSRFTVEVVRTFYEIYAKLLKRKPHEALDSPRKVFRVENCVSEYQQPMWVSVVGSSEDGLYGLAVFKNRLDVERRMAGGSNIWRRQPRCCHSRKANGVDGTKLKRCKPPIYNATTGEELVFSSSDAQKAAWRKVKHLAKKLDEREEGISTGRDWWGSGECSALYKHIVNLPFDEIDDIDKEEYAIGRERVPSDFQSKKYESESCHDGAGGSEGQVYPSLMRVSEGRIEDPTKEDMFCATIAATVILEVLSKGVETTTRAKWTKCHQMGKKEGDDAGSVLIEPEFESFKVATSGLELQKECPSYVECVYEPVWFESEVKKAMAAGESEEEEAARKKRSAKVVEEKVAAADRAIQEKRAKDALVDEVECESKDGEEQSKGCLIS